MRDIKLEIENIFKDYVLSDYIKVTLAECYEIIIDKEASDLDKTRAKAVAELYLDRKEDYIKKEKTIEKILWFF